jgi:hypothetical protein
MACSICGKEGHNKANCPQRGAAGEAPLKPDVWIRRIAVGVYVLAAVGVILYAIKVKGFDVSWEGLRPFIVGILITAVLLITLDFGYGQLKAHRSKATNFLAICMKVLFVAIAAACAVWLITLILQDAGLIPRILPGITPQPLSPEAKKQLIALRRISSYFSRKVTEREQTVESIRKYVDSRNRFDWIAVDLFREKLKSVPELVKRVSDTQLDKFSVSSRSLYKEMYGLLVQKEVIAGKLNELSGPPHSKDQLSELGRIADSLEKLLPKLALADDKLVDYLHEHGVDLIDGSGDE